MHLSSAHAQRISARDGGGKCVPARGCSGHEMYSYKHVLRSKHVIVGIYMHIEYEVCSMKYKSVSGLGSFRATTIFCRLRRMCGTPRSVGVWIIVSSEARRIFSQIINVVKCRMLQFYARVFVELELRYVQLPDVRLASRYALESSSCSSGNDI